ncbi:MAG TPA: citrate/2-methylcitrate synthase [Gaiellales bacterium]|jgi:citrate synthase|nr:citrate/2-methylcitrate synthase [Gaiellales bacterium]
MADKGGLEGVVVARSRLCSIDGQNGVLIYGGYDVGELAEQSSYEEVCFLTLHGRLPTREELDAFAAELVSHRQLSDETASVVDMLAGHAAPMEMLRTAVSSDSFDDPDKDANDLDANRRKATRLIAKMPTMVARYDRRRNGLEPVAPDPALGHAGNFLQMLAGERPTPAAEKTFDVALILHADHEMNASTFTARVIASTLSDMHSAITGAIGALKGPLHGGANEQVMKLLESIGPDASVEDEVRERLERRERIMGFGHRVYKTWDPRAVILKRFSKALAQESSEPHWFDMSERIERTVLSEKGLYPNVDFYSASTYHYLGIDTGLFTPIFAMSRVVGWVAHVIEQHSDNRLIRPSSEYVGPPPRAYEPIERRSVPSAAA